MCPGRLFFIFFTWVLNWEWCLKKASAYKFLQTVHELKKWVKLPDDQLTGSNERFLKLKFKHD